MIKLVVVFKTYKNTQRDTRYFHNIVGTERYVYNQHGAYMQMSRTSNWPTGVSPKQRIAHLESREKPRDISTRDCQVPRYMYKVRLTTELDRRARPNNQTDAILGCFRPMFVKRPPTNAGFDEQAHCEHVEVGPRSVFQCARWNNAAQVESPRTSCCGSPVFPCLTGTFSTRSLSTLSVEKHQHINTSNHQKH